MTELFIGLMSGTSLDGVDAVLADFSSAPPRLVAHAHHGFAAELREELLRLNSPGANELHRAAVASQHLARAYADAVNDVLLHTDVEAPQVAAIGAHGQTVRHRPEVGYTVQLNAPATLAELTGIDVIADFRSRDIAAGGQGAPLVPAFHASVFSAQVPRAIVNIGGIANITGLPGKEDLQQVIGFDVGPGNVLLDAWIRRHRDQAFDSDGAWAAEGTNDPSLLAALLAEPFVAQPPPKSTGRDLFNPAWLEAKLAGYSLASVDVQATLTEFTARCIGEAIGRYFAQAQEVVVCGGGAHNDALMRRLAAALQGRKLAPSSDYGIDPGHVEGLAFAWLARQHVLGLAGNLPAVTGAEQPRILGARYPK